MSHRHPPPPPPPINGHQSTPMQQHRDRERDRPPSTHSSRQIPPPVPNGQHTSPPQQRRGDSSRATYTDHPPPQPPTSAPPVSRSLMMLAEANEATWNLIGSIAEQMNDPDRAESAYEAALRHNPDSERALTQVASIARSREDYAKAIDFFQRALDVRQDNGEVWSSLGHCYLMQDDLQKAYTAYQQALYHLPNPKDPKLWYGIGILYDRYGSLDNAEEAFASVMRMDPKFDKAEEILFRLGIIYKQQQKYPESLDCFDRILRNPPSPLTSLDIWFQIGHVYEQAKNFEQAKEAYERVLAESDSHAKVLQQLGWLYHQPSSFTNQDMAINYLTKSLEADSSDAQSWYLLGRAFMTVQKYQKAYEAYQQAVYRDGRNPTFWCSIGVLYFNINQYRDALDAYSRAIRINPYIPEVWFDLGSLYESCNNQIGDAIDAYTRAADLDQNNQSIKNRLRLLKDVQANGGTMPAAPGPQDVHPTAYASAHGPPNTLGMAMSGPTFGGAGPPTQSYHHQQHHRYSHSHSRSNSRGDPHGHPMNGGHGRDLPAPSPTTRMGGGRQSSDAFHRHAELGQEPFRGGPPPPLNIDDSAPPRRSSGAHATLAPMETEQRGAPPPPPPHAYPEPPRSAANGAGGPSGSQQQPPPLHHPVPQPPLQGIPEIQQHTPLPPMSRASYEGGSGRRSPPSESPRAQAQGRRTTNPNPKSPTTNAPPPRNAYTPASSQSQPQGLPPPSTSAHHGLPYDRGTATSTSQPDRHDPLWERRHNRHDSRNTNGFHEPLPPAHPPPGQQQSAYYDGDRRLRSPGPGGHRREPSAERRDAQSPYPPGVSYPPPPTWSQGPQQPGSHHSSPNGAHRRPGSSGGPPPAKRYDPRFDGVEQPPPPSGPQPPPRREVPPPTTQPDRSGNGTPELGNSSSSRVMRAPIPVPAWRKESESPRPGSTTTATARNTAEPPPAKERRKRGPNKDKDSAAGGSTKKERKPAARRGKNQQHQAATEDASLPPPNGGGPSSAANSPPHFRAPSSSARPSPPTVAPTPPPPRPFIHRSTRSVDEDYDNDDSQDADRDRAENQNNAAAALMGLAGYRTGAGGRDATPQAPPAHPRSGSTGKLESLLNGPGPMTIDVSGRQSGGVKRVASDEEDGSSSRKRSRISSSSTSPLAPAHPSMSPINNMATTSSAQSRRTSMDITPSITPPGSHNLPPISTLPNPSSPSVDRGSPQLSRIASPT